MNKADLIASVQKNLGGPKAQAARAVEAVLDAIRAGLKKDKAHGVQVVGFGTFEVRTRKARTGRNPQTGETIRIAKSRTVAFRPSRALKDSV